MPEDLGKRIGSLRILVVEDEFLISLDLCEMLEQQGFSVVGPASSSDEGRRLAASEEIDGALLDLGLGRGQTSLPVADILARRHVPFIFLTGSDGHGLPVEIANRPFLSKPITSDRLAAMMHANFVRMPRGA